MPSLRARLSAAEVRLNPLAEQLFVDPRFVLPAQPALVPVTALSVAALGHADGATFSALAHSAQARGLAVCPLALAPFLRLQVAGACAWLPAASPASAPGRHRAPPGALTVASAPPPDEPDLPWGFYLRQIDGAPWLRGYRCWSGHVWSPGDVFVFMRDEGGAPSPLA